MGKAGDKREEHFVEQITFEKGKLLYYCCVSKKCYKSRMEYFSSVEFFKQRDVYGFRCQVSGVSKQMTEDRKLKPDDRGQVSF